MKQLLFSIALLASTSAAQAATPSYECWIEAFSGFQPGNTRFEGKTARFTPADEDRELQAPIVGVLIRTTAEGNDEIVRKDVVLGEASFFGFSRKNWQSNLWRKANILEVSASVRVPGFGHKGSLGAGLQLPWSAPYGSAMIGEIEEGKRSLVAHLNCKKK